MSPVALEISPERLADICRKWKVTELALFGSVLRADFRPDSDVDVLVSFAPDSRWSLFDIARMQEDLEKLFGRPVDIVVRAGLRNPFRRQAILRSAKVVYAA
jgi:hypothetical protein